MHYLQYDKNVVQHYRVEIRGWPRDIPFTTPSAIKSIVVLQTLHDAIIDGSCRWVSLTADEAKQRDKEQQAAGKEPKKCKTRSDKGKTRSDKDKHAKKQRKSSRLAQLPPTFISNEFVDDDDDDD
ncbi:hypothetical protein ARMGADRAFT_1081051 [Armillaria gallica]|uniref:Uncharacterized protein n=1 Tax=Armillaria gallica TaxID=47427 RepID=A0A2H3DVG6_ARMGA|nr:hypothetical protein ARMGADRAFT_1081051 [Armillaria gallica]